MFSPCCQLQACTRLLKRHPSRPTPRLANTLNSAPTCKVLFCVVEQQHLDLAPVVLIDHACTHIDKVLDSQARAGRHAAIGAWRGVDGDACADQLPAARWDDSVLTAVVVVVKVMFWCSVK